MATKCEVCGSKKTFADVLIGDLGESRYVCQPCKDAKARQAAADEAAEAKRIKAIADKVILTTTPKVDGYHVAAYLGIESVEFVIGTAIFSEISSDIADFFGKRSTAFEKKLQDAKSHAMSALKIVAARKGANAVIGVDLDYAEFSGNRVALIINGTLVKVVPNRAAS